MSHNAATLNRQDSNEGGDATLATGASWRGNRVTRVMTALVLAIATTLGVGMATAAPASAASYVEGCFRSPTPGMGFAGMPVNLQYWTGSQWVNAWTGNLGSNSCTSVNIVGDLRYRYVQLAVSQRVGTAYFYGASPYYASPGTLRYSLGTGTVYCTGCR